MNKTGILHGTKVLVTRPKHQAAELSGLLKQSGATVVEMPLIVIGPPADWQPFDQAFGRKEIYDWLIFASVNAVNCTLSRLHEIGKQNKIKQSKLAAIGPATAAALNDFQLKTDYYPTSFVAESFVAEFPGYPQLSGKRILWPKTDIGRTLIADELRRHEAVVDIVHCYSTTGPKNPDQCRQELIGMLSKEEIDIITLTSSETVKSLHKLLTKVGDVKQLLAGTRIAVIGPETAKTAQQLLGKVDIQAQEFTVNGLVSEVLRTIN